MINNEIINKIKFYKSTAGCGYRQYAIVTPIKKTKNGYDCLCVWTNEKSSFVQTHTEGEIIEDLEDIYLEDIEININDYPISKTFLFKFFIENFSFK